MLDLQAFRTETKAMDIRSILMAQRPFYIRDIAELMLNHKEKGLDGIYDQNEELELRRKAAGEGFLHNMTQTAGIIASWASGLADLAMRPFQMNAMCRSVIGRSSGSTLSRTSRFAPD